MKKTILIVIGVALILLIAGAWVYLFMYGAPKDTGEVFSRFGFGDNEPAPGIVVDGGNTAVDVSDETPSGAPQKLRQLTVKPVAGAEFTDSGILYVEEGTGHVYHIDFGSGEERLLSGTTLPGAHDASFSKDGSYVAITRVDAGASLTTVGYIDGLAGSLTGISLPKGAREVHFGDASSTVFYLLPSASGSSGYSYDIEGELGVELFKIPLRDVRVLWGDTIYVYTTPTYRERGYVYRVEKNSLAYVGSGRLGLGALLYEDGVVTTGVTGGEISSVAQSFSGTTTELSLPLIPEKCTGNASASTTFYCGIPSELSPSTYPDAWYMGTLSYSDMLMGVNPETNEWTLWSDLLEESGREIDISKIGTDDFGEQIYFINKNDNTLWVFDTTL